ncbi:MAG: hypothetical protein FE047_00685 [Thermoplasmata archaeon]|nr:MAG: hypothetical protein FE047_00685 [Thermoplasmata archaeon]
MKEDNFVEKLQEEIEVMERHLKMLTIIRREGPIGIIKLSEITGFPAHKVRYSLRILESSGLIRPSVNGAVVTEKTEEFINQFRNILNKLVERLQNLEKSLLPR